MIKHRLRTKKSVTKSSINSSSDDSSVNEHTSSSTSFLDDNNSIHNYDGDGIMSSSKSSTSISRIISDNSQKRQQHQEQQQQQRRRTTMKSGFLIKKRSSSVSSSSSNSLKDVRVEEDPQRQKFSSTKAENPNNQQNNGMKKNPLLNVGDAANNLLASLASNLVNANKSKRIGHNTNSSSSKRDGGNNRKSNNSHDTRMSITSGETLSLGRDDDGRGDGTGRTSTSVASGSSNSTPTTSNMSSRTTSSVSEFSVSNIDSKGETNTTDATSTTASNIEEPNSFDSTSITVSDQHSKNIQHNTRSKSIISVANNLVPRLPKSVTLWMSSVDALSRTKELHDFWDCSVHLVHDAATLAFRTAIFFPVTVPVRVATTTTDLALSTCIRTLACSGAILQFVLQKSFGTESSRRRSSTNRSLSARLRLTDSISANAEGGRKFVQDDAEHMPNLLLPTSEKLEPQQEEVTALSSGDLQQQQKSTVKRSEALIITPDVSTADALNIVSMDESSSASGNINCNKPTEENIFGQVLGLPSLVLGVVGSILLDAVTPNNKHIKYLDDNDRDKDFLNRLRLEYCSDSVLVDQATDLAEVDRSTEANARARRGPDIEKPVQSIDGVAAIATNTEPELTKTSLFLLRVDDIGLEITQASGPLHGQTKAQSKRVCFVDLDSKADSELIERALSTMVAKGISLLSNHPTVRLNSNKQQQDVSATAPSEGNGKISKGIEWKPEGGTHKLLRRMHSMTTLERLRLLETEILCWSGKMKDSPSDIHNQYPLFLARGIVELSPRDFMHLLWDNSRTTEYNNYCLGRKNLLVVEDEVLSSGASKATKAIQSETRVPFTSMSVFVKCVMHVRPLEGGPEEGYIIVSRSLDTGRGGWHDNSDHVEDSGHNNEILWGINILRRVPNHPHLTDLTSLSQMASTLIPQFLATRIGLMGIEDFFRNVRKPKLTN